MERIGGIIQIAADGVNFDAKGEFSHNLGAPLRKGLAGADRVHGYTETVQVPFIEGKITDTSRLNKKDLLNIKNATVTFVTPNGKTVMLRDAFYAGEGTFTSGEGEGDLRFEGFDAEEI